MGSCSLLQGVFPTQGLNPGLPHCRWILYQLSHQGIITESKWTNWPCVYTCCVCVCVCRSTVLYVWVCSCLENPRDGGAWWAASYGVAQSRTRLKRLSSSSRLRETGWEWKKEKSHWTKIWLGYVGIHNQWFLCTNTTLFCIIGFHRHLYTKADFKISRRSENLISRNIQKKRWQEVVRMSRRSL